ncbi:MAG TPA: hypothetical protein VFN35_15045 [Ktedonobacteraceae bacterium]|nr:hypothetical protein [Ktedonobacteraceae bacterium]
MDHIDIQGGLRVPAVKVNQKCEECGKPGPSFKWEKPGILSRVLCRECLEKAVKQTNQASKTTFQEDR